MIGEIAGTAVGRGVDCLFWRGPWYLPNGFVRGRRDGEKASGFTRINAEGPIGHDEWKGSRHRGEGEGGKSIKGGGGTVCDYILMHLQHFEK